MTKYSILPILVLIFATFLMGAGDVRGIWEGRLDLAFPNGEKITSHLHVNLRQSGTEITGTAGPSERKQSTIRNGNVNGDRISVGRPYFDRMTGPIALALLFLMAVAPALPWRKASAELLRTRLQIPAWAGAVTIMARRCGGCVSAVSQELRAPYEAPERQTFPSDEYGPPLIPRHRCAHLP